MFANRKMKGLYKMEAVFDVPAENLKLEFHKAFRNRCFSLISYEEELEHLSEQYNVLYQKYEIEGMTYKVMVIEELQCLDFEDYVLFVKGIHTVNSGSFIEFVAAMIND